MSEQKTFQPIKTVEEFETAYNKLLPHMPTENALEALVALNTLKELGLPCASEYSLKSITAHNNEDLKLKILLSTLPPVLAMVNDEITQDEMSEVLAPITKALLSSIRGGVSGDVVWPVTITADES